MFIIFYKVICYAYYQLTYTFFFLNVATPRENNTLRKNKLYIGCTAAFEVHLRPFINHRPTLVNKRDISIKPPPIL